MKDPIVRFYDNEENNFIGNNFSNMECILINDKKLNIFLKKKTFYPQLYYIEYILKHPFDLEFIKLSTDYYSITYEKNPPNNGIEKKHIEELKDWCMEYKKKDKYIFFDWDRTISVTDGFQYLPKIPMKQLKEYIYYILGGKERFNELKNLFSFLHKNKVNIYILTNNPTANEKYKDYFLTIIHTIDKKFKSKHLLYGLKYNHKIDKNGEIIKSNKLVFLEKEFPKLFL